MGLFGSSSSSNATANTDESISSYPSSFGSLGSPVSPSASSGGGDVNAKKQELMDRVRLELAQANVQELHGKMSEKCFDRCVTKPGYKLESGEQQCISKCVDRYIEAWNLVSGVITKVTRERQAQMGAGGMSL